MRGPSGNGGIFTQLPGDVTERPPSIIRLTNGRFRLPKSTRRAKKEEIGREQKVAIIGHSNGVDSGVDNKNLSRVAPRCLRLTQLGTTTSYFTGKCLFE